MLAEQTISTKVKEDKDDDDGSGDGSGSGDGDGTGSGSGSGYDYGGTGSGYNFGDGTDYSSGPNYTPNFNIPDSGGSGRGQPDPSVPTDPNEEPEIEEETGIPVTGELMSAVAPLSPSDSGDAATSAEDEAEPDAEEIVEEAKEVSAPGALIAGGIIVGLLGLGAGRELETVRPRRLTKRPDFSALRRLSPPWK